MTDALLSWPLADAAPDLSIVAEDLARDDGLATAVIISLFTDARAPSGPDRRGWWADALDGDATGSLLWLLRREKSTTETARRAEDYAQAALAWMVDDGVAESVAASAVWRDDERLRLTVVMQTGGAETEWSFEDALRGG